MARSVEIDAAWTQLHARRIVRAAERYHGEAWHEMTPRQRERACAPDVVTLVMSQAEGDPDVITHLRALIRELYRRTGNE